MLHAGIDLHKNDLVIGTLDPAGVLIHQQHLRTQRPVVAAYFRSLPGPHRAVVESTASSSRPESARSPKLRLSDQPPGLRERSPTGHEDLATLFPRSAF